MKSLTYLISSIKNEIIKLKGTFALLLSIISSLSIPIIFFIYYVLKYKSLIPNEGINPWNKFMYVQIMIASSSLLAPLFIVLITYLIVQIEHKSSGIKYLFTLPTPKWSIYFGKLIVTIGLILVTYLMFLIFMLISGYALGIIHNDLNFLKYFPDFEKPIKLLFRSLIAVLAMASLQFWLSFRIKNFIIPLGIGIVLVITGSIIHKAEGALYFPYAYNSLSISPSKEEESTIALWLPKVCVLSMYYFTAFSILGYLSIKRMNIK